jgi:hypothetical protein
MGETSGTEAHDGNRLQESEGREKQDDSSIFMVHPENEYLRIGGDLVACTSRATALRYGFSQHRRQSGDTSMRANTGRGIEDRATCRILNGSANACLSSAQFLLLVARIRCRFSSRIRPRNTPRDSLGIKVRHYSGN